MNITYTHNDWEFEVLGHTLTVSITKDTYDRGGQMGETCNYGSSIKYEGPYGAHVSHISIVDRDRPNCKPSLKDILLEHSRQQKLGTFGEIDSAHEYNNQMFVHALSFLGEDFIDDGVSEYIQIPFVVNIADTICQTWEITHEPHNVIYKAYRRYEDSYYVTKVERELNCYEHPLRDGVPDNNIISRKESIETTSLKAAPLQLDDVVKLFN